MRSGRALRDIVTHTGTAATGGVGPIRPTRTKSPTHPRPRVPLRPGPEVGTYHCGTLPHVGRAELFQTLQANGLTRGDGSHNRFQANALKASARALSTASVCGTECSKVPSGMPRP